MKKNVFAAISVILMVLIVAVACDEDDASSRTPSAELEEGNFSLLISDDVNAIEHFQELWVRISSIGVQQGGESGFWSQVTPTLDEVELTQLTGSNAIQVWQGDIPPGEYTKVFIYIEDVWGTLIDDKGGQSVELTLPSDKLQIKKPFEVATDLVTEFIFDITVIATGSEQSGIEYKLKPEITQSGADQSFKEVKQEGKPDERLQLQLIGDVEAAGVVTLMVTKSGSPVGAAEVSVNDTYLGETDSEGAMELELPLDLEGLEIKVEFGDMEGELEIEVEEDGEGEDEGDEKDKDPGREDYEGIITRVDESTWTVALKCVGETIVYVTILEEGMPQIGSEVEIEGMLSDGTIENAVANVEEFDDDNDLEGIITAVNADNELEVALKGIGKVTVLLEQPAEGTPAVGAEVELEGDLVEGEVHGAVADVEACEEGTHMPSIAVKKSAMATENGAEGEITITNTGEASVVIESISDTMYWQAGGGAWQPLTVGNLLVAMDQDSSATALEPGLEIPAGESWTFDYSVTFETPVGASELRNIIEIEIESRDEVFHDIVGFHPYDRG